MANVLAEERQSIPGRRPGGSSSCLVCEGKCIKKFLRAPDRFHLRQEFYQLMRCGKCGCVWLADPPSPEQMGIHYSDDYHRGIAAAGEGDALERWERHRDLIQRYKRGGAILDIGCSSGAFLSTMKSDGWKLHGIELEQTTADKARAATGAEVFVGDAMDAPFAPASFDAITSFDVLEHMYDPRAFLSRILQWLKPGGIYFTMLPNIDSWEARVFGSYWYGLELPRHTFHFSPRSLRRLAMSVGFQEVHLATPRISYVERSLGYLCSAGLEMLGMVATPQCRPKPPGIPKRIVRKALWLAVIQPFAALESTAGAAASIEAVFQKPAIEG